MFQLTALSAAITANTKSDSSLIGEDGFVQALPDGAFSSVDGRPQDVRSGQWLMDAQAFAALKANTPHQIGDLVVDYEHQTLSKKINGQPAPAAGFFNIDDIEYREGKGLYIKPRFTVNAITMLSAGEYKYFSLVFGYDTDTGRPAYIHSAALTNRPGVDGMEPLAALSAELNLRFYADNNELHLRSNEESKVNELLKQMLAKLGIELSGEPTPEQATAALSALDEMKTNAAKVDGLNQQVVALSAQDNNTGVNLTQYVPVSDYNAVCNELASLSAENGKLTIEQTVKQALAEGRAMPSQEAYLTNLGRQHGLAALTASIDSRSPIKALSIQQTQTVTKPEANTSEAALSAEETQMANSWGMSLEEFVNAKKEQD